MSWDRPVGLRPEFAAEYARRTITPAEQLRPCRSPYCECDVGKCTHPGYYDARGQIVVDDIGQD